MLLILALAKRLVLIYQVRRLALWQAEYKRKVYDEDWYLGETFDAAIGQSFTLVTPLQMAVLLSEVANGGIKYKPYVVSRIDNKDGTPKEIFGPDKLGILPVPKNIMDLIREGLRDVTNEVVQQGIYLKASQLM